MLTLIMIVAAVYLFSGLFRGVFRFGWGLMKAVFSLGLFVLLPVFLIISLVLGLIASCWPALLVIGLICLAGRRRGIA